MLSRIRRKDSINSQSAFFTRSAICILYLVYILYSVCCLQSAVFILYWPHWYCCFCSSKPWPLWLMCRLYVEELPKTSTMIELWLLYTNWRRTQIPGLTIRLPLIPFCVVTACVEMNPLRVPLGVNISASQFKLHFYKLGNVIWGYYFYQTIQTFYFFPRAVSSWASSKLILTFY